MENTSATYLPFARQLLLIGHNRKCIGAGVSFIFHTAVVCCIFFLGPSLADFKPPLVIDFSIDHVSKPAKIKKVVHQVEPEQVPPPPLPVQEEVVLPETTMPEKVETVEVPKVIPEETKKEIAEEIIPKPVVEEKVDPEVTEPEEIVSEPLVAAEDVMEDDREEAPSAEVSTQAKAEETVNSFSFQQQKYIKEHFNYIKERVQKKIVYPPIARRMGWEGKVLVSFVICLDGSVKDLHIRESSGHKALDKNAIDVIRKGAPFPKPPVSAELIIPVVYKLS